MVKFLLAIVLAIGVAAPAVASSNQYYTSSRAGESPFPWGSESPFPWKIADGMWKITKTTKPVPKPIYFKFETVRSSLSANRFLRVRLYDNNGSLIGEGMGVTREGDQVIRARVLGAKFDSYALIRAYNRRATGAVCSNNECVMVITIREKEPVQGNDVHFIVEKMPNK